MYDALVLVDLFHYLLIIWVAFPIYLSTFSIFNSLYRGWMVNRKGIELERGLF